MSVAQAAVVQDENKVIVLNKDTDGDLESGTSVIHEENGKCSPTFEVEVVPENHLGMWSCTLIDQTGGFFSGKIELDTIDSTVRA